jgi:hypothetical protein
MRAVLGTIAGIIVSAVVNMGIIMLFIPMDPSVDFNNPEALIEMFKDFTAIDYMIPLSAHLFGLLAGLLTARAICKTSNLPLLIIVSVHMAGTVLNLYQLPHPFWFAVVDVVGPILILVAFLKKRKN